MFCCRFLYLVLAMMALAACQSSRLVEASDWDFVKCSQEPLFLTIDSPGKPHNLKEDKDIVRAGSHSLRFELRQGERWMKGEGLPGHASHRVEVRDNYHAPFDRDVYYGFSLFIPPDFPIHDERLVIGQWNGENDTELREIPRSPALVQRFRNGRFYIQVRWSDVLIQDRSTLNDPDKKKTIFETQNFPLGKWVDFVYRVRWNYADKGLVQVWMNGSLIADYRGSVGYFDQEGPFFKFGLYRDDVPSTYVVYFDEYRRSFSPEILNSRKKDCLQSENIELQ